jgi:DNA end-binding protein Ku
MATSVWNGHISFGLVSVPVKLVVAARSETISFNQLHKTDHSRVKQVLYCQAEDKPVERAELVKGYEYEKGKYVIIDEADMEKVRPRSAKVMEILEFVKAADVDGVYLESSFYVQPSEAGEKPYTLLFAAMKESGYAAVARITMHQREHVVLLRPGRRGLILHTLYYQDEVRAVEEFRTDASNAKAGELKMAQTLIEAMAGEFEPEQFHDTYRAQITAMIEAKVQGREVVEAPEAQELTPVIDMMEALKKSLALTRKPPAVERELRPAAAKKAKPSAKRAAG